jgi:hypothetical protein
MAGAGRERTGGFGKRNGDKQTFVHGSPQRKPSTLNGPTAGATWTAAWHDASSPFLPCTSAITAVMSHFNWGKSTGLVNRIDHEEMATLNIESDTFHPE